MKKIDYAALFTLRSDGRYMATYKDEKGKRHAVYDRDPEKLWHKVNDPKEPKVVTFRDIAEAWHDHHWENIRDGTKACYTAPYNRAVAMYGDKPAADLMPSDVKAHLENMRLHDYGARVIKAQRSIYHLIYQYAIADEEYGKIIRYNPADSLQLPTGIKRPKKRKAPEDDIIARIRSEAQTAYYGIFCLTLISTGFRRGEALALQWKDVDFDEETISCTKTLSYHTGSPKIGPPKTENGVRAVPILPDLLPVLTAYKPSDAAPDDFVFYGTEPSKPMPQRTYVRRWHHYCMDMGFVEDHPETRKSAQGKIYVKHNYKNTLSPHVMRHGYATMLYDAGVDPYTAQKLLGHSDIQTTLAIYTHLKQEREKGSLTKLKDYVSNSISKASGK